MKGMSLQRISQANRGLVPHKLVLRLDADTVSALRRLGTPAGRGQRGGVADYVRNLIKEHLDAQRPNLQGQ
jgi:hypothetical protein